MAIRSFISGWMPLAGLAAVLLTLSPQAVADIKCWHNDDGGRECAQVIPPEHAHRRIEVINDRGVTIKIIEAAPTAEELAERERQERLRKEEEKRRAEQARKDDILLRSYTTEQDIIIARDNNLRAVESIIDISEGSLRTLRDSLDHLKKRAADYERAGKKPPDDLLEQMESVRQQIESKKAYIEKKQIEKQRMKEKFQADLERFRYLKDKKNEEARAASE